MESQEHACLHCSETFDCEEQASNHEGYCAILTKLKFIGIELSMKQVEFLVNKGLLHLSALDYRHHVAVQQSGFSQQGPDLFDSAYAELVVED